MALTKAQRYLIDGLMVCEVKQGIAAAIYMTLQTDEQMWEMCDYLAEHRNEVPEKLLEEARRIAGM